MKRKKKSRASKVRTQLSVSNGRNRNHNKGDRRMKKKTKWIISDVVNLGDRDNRGVTPESDQEGSDITALQKILLKENASTPIGSIGEPVSPAVLEYQKRFHLAEKCVAKYLEELDDPAIEGHWLKLHEDGGFTVSLCRCSQPHDWGQKLEDVPPQEKVSRD